MSWNIGDNRNLFPKLKTKLGLYYVELRSKHKSFSEKITLLLVETQQMPYIERADSKDEISCLKGQFIMVEEKYAPFFKLIQTR